MTIKQQGGVFGRNPTFNDVDVEGDLDVQGSVSVPNDSISGDAINGGTATPAAVDTGNLSADGVVAFIDPTSWDLQSARLTADGVSANSMRSNGISKSGGDQEEHDVRVGAFLFPITGVELSDAVIRSGDKWRVLFIGSWFNYFNGLDAVAAGFVSEATSDSNTITVGSLNLVITRDGTSGKLIAASNSGYSIAFQGQVIITQANGSPANSIYMKNDIKTDGNFVVTSGKGIDFSATSGTGTSELFDDYEEGTWTPEFVGSTSGSLSFGTVNQATYTKIGRLVYLNCYLSAGDVLNNTVVGSIEIGGLPYSADPFSAQVTVVLCNLFNFDETDTAILGYTTGTKLRFVKGSSNSVIADADLNTTGSTGTIMIQATYEAL